MQPIGEGGMGTVWMAQQEEPVRRRVALKLIRNDLGSRDTVGRFDAERQAVALMDHQNIARFFDVGTTDFGAPYFAMELVNGIPITAYCDKNKLSVKERLELMIPVCNAIQHAHQKGIIHRDIKPSNILVTLYDGKPVAKVIDFGLAKALDQRQKLTDNTVLTEYGKVVGTLQYMSPEQAELNALDVDTRTDIYSLGVILYELLAGSTPVRKETVDSNVLFKVLEIIREKEPPAPSIRLNESTLSKQSALKEKDSKTSQSGSSIGSLRKSNELELERLLKGELDWIVMKSLEKDRTRRYETASELAADVKRFLNDEPILARPQSTAYKVKRFIRKNKGLVTAAAIIVGLMIAGAAGTTIFALKEYEARKEAEKLRRSAVAQAEKAFLERDRAAKSREEARRSEKLAKESKQKALESAKRAEDILKIVTKSFESANPFLGVDADLRAIDVLVKTREIMEASELDDEGKLFLSRRLSNLFIILGENDLSVASARMGLKLTRKIDPNHPELYKAIANLADAESQAGNYKKGIGLYKEALALIDESQVEEPATRLSALNGIGLVLSRAGRNREAIRYLKLAVEGRSQEYGPTDYRTINSRGNLGMAISKSGDPKGLDELKEALALGKEHLHVDHPFTLSIKSSIASTYHRAGDLDEAKKCYLELLVARTKKLGINHPTNTGTRSNIALIDLAQGKTIQSLDQFDDLVKLQNETQGKDHPEAVATFGNRSIALNGVRMQLQESLSRGDFAKAEDLSNALIRHADLQTSPDRTQAARGQHFSRLAQKKHEQAYESLKLWQAELATTEKNNSDTKKLTNEFSKTLVSEAFCLYGLKKFAEAAAAIQEAIQLPVIDKTDLLRSQILLACCLAHDDKTDEALEQAVESFNKLEQQMEVLPPSEKWLVALSCEQVVEIFQLAEDSDGTNEWTEKLNSIRADLKEVYKSAISFKEAQETNEAIWTLVGVAPANENKRLTEEQLEEMRKVCQYFPIGIYMNTLALSEFRMGNYLEAIAASNISIEKLPRELGLPAPFPGDYGVIAASHLMLGEKAEAQKFRAMMAEGFKSKRFRNDADCVRLVKEVNKLFASQKAQAIAVSE